MKQIRAFFPVLKTDCNINPGPPDAEDPDLGVQFQAGNRQNLLKSENSDFSKSRNFGEQFESSKH